MVYRELMEQEINEKLLAITKSMLRHFDIPQNVENKIIDFLNNNKSVDATKLELFLSDLSKNEPQDVVQQVVGFFKMRLE